MNFIAILGFLGTIVGIIMLIPTILKKQKKRQPLIVIVSSFIVFIVATALSPVAEPSIYLNASKVKTNDEGVALIEGKLDDVTTLTANGEEISFTNSHFSYEATLKDKNNEKIIFVVKNGDKEKSIVAEISPSKEFLASLEEGQKEQENAIEAETALALAEKEPTQKNYDEAATRIQALSKEQQKTYSSRLKAVSQKIADEQKQQKAIASAQEAVSKAEQEPTNENYQQATTAIKALEKSDAALSNRVAKVKEAIDTQEKQQAAAEKKAEEERLAQEQAQAAQVAAAEAAAQQEAQQAANQSASGETVLVTATGSKYHTHKCGNGTYTPATLEEAQARGLTPCEKCY